MGKLPRVTPRQVVAVLHRVGFIDDRQTGAHLILRHPITRRRAVVSIHRRDLKLKTLKSILADAGLTPEEFHELL
ncbi:MAG TPA: type II toxin-antitoxin system HicA family toxin [Tepidisphaeraceae bacterium]|jgi:predicted RNA binding protein YcfA (HicA-like mRNA interferase family)|nr:type II toxin-antitoxin system HicA family toxin [Tepidisphaeraceae bacterium]